MVGETCSRKGTFRRDRIYPVSSKFTDVLSDGDSKCWGNRPAFFQVLVTKMVVGTGPGLIINIFIFIFLVTELAVTTTSDSSC